MCLNISTNKTLEEQIKKVIKLTGPIPMRHYINECLYNAKYGYYMNGAKIGLNTGDFITAPQKSSLFCLLVAHCVRFELENIYENTNSKVTLVEIGAGKGNLIVTLMDLLRDEYNKIEQVCLVECSSACREEQFKRLECRSISESDANTELNKGCLAGITPNNVKIYWCNTIYELDRFKDTKSPFIFYCNEYFDTIPIQQYVKTIESDENSWKAVHVGLDDKTDELILTLRKDHQLKRYETEILSKYYRSREWAEFSMDMYAQWRYLMEFIDKGIAGSLLNIDYGYTKDQIPKSVTLRAFKDHKVVSVLDNPGDCDITADLDFNTFESITQLYPNLISHRVITQAEFLFNMKIDIFKEKLKQWLPDKIESIDNDVKYLTDSAFMGSRFKVHLVGHKSQTLPLCHF